MRKSSPFSLALLLLSLVGMVSLTAAQTATLSDGDAVSLESGSSPAALSSGDYSALTTTTSAVVSTESAEETRTTQRLVSCDTNGAVVEVSFPEASLASFDNGEQQFTEILLTDCQVEGEPGATGLPEYTVRLWVPPTAVVTPSVSFTTAYSLSVANPLPVPDYDEVTYREITSLEPRYESDPALMMMSVAETEVVESGLVRGWRLLKVVIRPLSWQSDTLTGYRQAKLQISFSYPGGGVAPSLNISDSSDQLALCSSLAPNFEIARSLGWRSDAGEFATTTAAGISTLSGDVLKVVVEEEGLYTVTYDDLVNAGWDPAAVDPHRLALYTSSGQMLSRADATDTDPLYAIPLHFEGEDDGVFNEGDAVYFWGRGTTRWAEFSIGLYSERNNFSRYGYYFLTEEDAPRRFTEIDAAPDSAPILEYLEGRTHLEEDYLDYTRNKINNVADMDLYWWSSVPYGTTGTTFEYSLYDLYTGAGDAQLALRMKIKGNGGSYVNTRLYLGQDGGDPDDLLFDVKYGDRRTLYSPRAELPIERLTSGTNYITLTVDEDDPSSDELIGVDCFDVLYPQGLNARQGVYSAWAPPEIDETRALTISGFSTTELQVWDTTTGESLVNYEMTGTGNSRRVSFEWQVDRGNHLVVADLSKAAAPLDVYPAHRGNVTDPVAADIIYVAHPSLVNALDPLVDFHRGNGKRVVVVRTDDLYDEYSGGRLSPWAIRNYLYNAYHNAIGDPVSYVTLVGDCSGDYRDSENLYSGPSWRDYASNLLPVVYYQYSAGLTTPSDNIYASLVGSDNAPDVAISRMSAYEPAQIEEIVRRTVAYPEIEGGFWQATHGLLVDNTVYYSGDEWPSEGILFDLDAEFLVNLHGSSAFLHDKIYLTGLGVARTGDRDYTPVEFAPDVRQKVTRDHITPRYREALERGMLIFSFIGHGAWHTWLHELAYTNRPPIFVDHSMWNCTIPPLLIQSSCSTGDFDRVKINNPDCTAEHALWVPNGVLATTAASRTTSGGAAISYHAYIFEAFFHRTNRLDVPALGLAHQYAVTTYGHSVRVRQHLFGDAATLLRVPQGGIELDSYGGSSVAKGEVITVSGELTDPTLDSESVLLVAYDRPLLPYTYNNTRLYRRVASATAPVTNGQFSGQLALPLNMNEDITEGPPPNDPLTGVSIPLANDYHLEIHAYALSADGKTYAVEAPLNGDPILELPITGEVDPPTNNGGPTVEFYLDEGKVSQGDTVNGKLTFTAELSDDHGLLIVRSDGNVPMRYGDIDQPITLIAEGENFTLNLDLTDYYEPASDDYTRGRVSRKLDLPPGEYTLTVYCYDRFGEPGSGSFELTVAERMTLDDVLVVPNPVTGPTAFTFISSHRPDNARIRIYTSAGRCVRTITAGSLNAGFNSVPWDGLDSSGRTLANGVYLYSVEVSGAGNRDKVIEKLIMLR